MGGYGQALLFFAGLVIGIALMGVFVYSLDSIKNVRKKRSERTLLKNLAQVFQYSLYYAPIGIAVVDHREDILYKNPEAGRLGIMSARILNPVIWEAAQEILSSPDPFAEAVLALDSKDFSVPSRDSSILCVSVKVRRLSPEDDRFVVVYAEDNSQRIRFLQAQQDFIANVSHELKTPISAISLLVETLIQVSDDPAAIEYFGAKLTDETERLSSMTSELLALVELETSRSDSFDQEIFVDELVASAVDACMLSAEQAEVELVVSTPEGLVIRGHQALLGTVLRNLLINAIHYSEEESTVALSVKVGKGERGDSLVVRVTDHGPGIAPEAQSNVFDRFFRVDKARSRVVGGTGLGLSMVKKIIELHGGEVNLWSRENVGSTFSFTIPIVEP